MEEKNVPTKIEVIAMQNPQKSKFLTGENIRKDAVSLFVEHRNLESCLGEIGGDGYPIVWSDVLGDKKYGIAFAADGVGNGCFKHQSLINFVQKFKTEEDKLFGFLQALYGDEFFNDEEAIDYAVRSFLPVPPNCFYSTKSEKAPVFDPFYEKDSQYLSSRIVLIGIFYKFRRFFSDKEMTLENIKLLRESVEYYVDGKSDERGELLEKGELRQNIEKIFDVENDGSRLEDRTKYFLPCTFAGWFFVSYENSDEPVKAVSLYLGDARAYKVDLDDGVLLMSSDDANLYDNNMNCCVRYGKERHFIEETLMHDCAVKAVYAEIKKPCALFACSDGVYDTCLPIVVSDNDKLGMPTTTDDVIKAHEDVHETNDIAFERNFLYMLRKCYTLDDISQKTARFIYTHARLNEVGKVGCFSRVTQIGNDESIKRDDSATMGMIFFGFDDNGFPSVITGLRKEKNTSLDVLIDELNKTRDGCRYCYKVPPLEQSPSSIESKCYVDYSQKPQIAEFLKNCASEDSQKAVDAGKNTVWGEYTDSVLTKFSLRRFYNSKCSHFLKRAIEESKQLKLRDNPEYKPKVLYSKIQEKYSKLKDLAVKIVEIDVKACKNNELAVMLNAFVANMFNINQIFKNLLVVDKKDPETNKKYESLAELFIEKTSATKEFLDEYVKEIDDDEQKSHIEELGEFIKKCGGVIDIVKNNVDALFEEYKGKKDVIKALGLIESIKGANTEKEKLLKEIKDTVNDLIKLVEGKKSSVVKANVEAVMKLLNVKNAFLVDEKTKKMQGADFSKVKITKEVVGQMPESVIGELKDVLFIPDDWSYETHILTSQERYDAINVIVSKTFGVKGLYAIETVIEKEVKEKLKESNYDLLSEEYERYQRDAYVCKSQNPIIEGEGYKAIYQAFNRGIKG